MDTKAISSNFAVERRNSVEVLENLTDSDVDVGVDAVKSGVTADPGQPAGALDGDLPRFNRLHWRLFDHLCFFLCTSPSRDEWKKEKWYYA